MEADAFQVLSRYLESLNDTYRNTDGGKEIVEDIEARIAELILSHQDNSKVVKLSLVEEIIAQMGSAEAIREQEGREAPRGEGRIPRRLYRDMDQARLGGVCSGVAKYFGTSPTWIRLLMFLPLILLLLLGWIPFFWWLVPLMSNLLGVFFICYLIMWFAVPAARTARQKLEQNGQRITVQSIEEASAANHDVDADAKPVVAKAVYALGQVVLIVLKLLAAGRLQHRAALLDDIAHGIRLQVDDFVIDQSLITAHNTFYGIPVIDRRTRHGTDRGIHPGSIAPRSQHSDTLNCSHTFSFY